MIEKIYANNNLLSIIIRKSFNDNGVHFFTEDSYSQQLAYMRHPIGKVIDPHIHNPILREVHLTQEVLIIKSGRLRVDFYDDLKVYKESRVLETGDVILLAYGGHGFEVLDEVEMIEVKQGPYSGEADKTRFKGVEPRQVMLSSSL